MKKALKIIGIIFAVFLVIGILSAIFGESDDTSNEAATETVQKEEIKVAESKWGYTEKVNEMDDTKTYYAMLKSENKIDFEFPYDGGSTFQFTVRKTNGRYEFVLNVSKGQFMTNILDEEKLRIRFDDNQVFNWNYSNAADASTDVIFPEYSDDFLAHLKASKMMMIEAPFAFAGRKVIRFKTENLKADF